MKAFLDENLTKILGWLTTVLASVQGLITINAFDGLMAETDIRWMSIIVVLLTGGTGGATIARGHVNTAKVAVASAMQDAINATPPPKQGGFARPGFLMLIVIAAVVFLSGCSGNQTVAKEVGYRIVTRQAIQRYIWDAGTDERRAARADRIRLAATALRGLASGDGVTIDQLRAAGYAEIDKHNLIPPDRDLLRQVVDEVSGALQGEVGAGVLDPDRLVRIDEVLGWIVSAAYYEPVPASSDLYDTEAIWLPAVIET